MLLQKKLVFTVLSWLRQSTGVIEQACHCHSVEHVQAPGQLLH